MPKRKEELSEELKNSIMNYANAFESIDEFIDAVRKMPGMYIGAIGNTGYLACIREIFQNAVDEAIRKNSPCHYIKVSFDERTQKAVIEDTGRGIPHGMIIKVYRTEHMSTNYNKKPGEYTSGVHGVGSGVALALSKYFEVDSYILGKAKKVIFDSGIPWSKGEVNIPCPSGKQGTVVTMTPDFSVLGDVTLTCKNIHDLIFSVFPLLNIGDRIDFIGIDKAGNTVFNQQMVNTDGIITDLNMKTKTKLITPVYFGADTGITRAEIAFTYDASDLTSAEDITAFSNFSPTPLGGTHLDGFLDGLCAYFRKYMNNIYLGEKSKITVINNDIKTGLKGIVVAAHLEPIFGGQFKAVLTNQDMYDFVKKLTIESLEAWSKTNPGDLQKVCKYIKEIADIRRKSDADKIKLSSNYTANSLTRMPEKYVAPSHQKKELFIVEGDSALGGARYARDHKTQAIYPIRGKMPNAFDKSASSFLKNEEVASIITIVGGGYGRDFDISKVKWDKIIIMADADPDGSHISTLVLRFFLLYMPDMIKYGKLYKSIPPLFGIPSGKKTKYFDTKLDFTKYVQSIFNNNNQLCYPDGKKLNNGEITKLFYNYIDYNYDVDILSNTFAVDPQLLECILYELAPFIICGVQGDLMAAMAATAVRKKKKAAAKKPMTKEEKFKKEVGASGRKKEASEDDEKSVAVSLTDGSVMSGIGNYIMKPTFSYKAFKSIIEKKYRFLKVSQQNDTILVQGLVNSKYQYVFINDYFIRNCVPVIKSIQEATNLYFLMNGNESSIYDVMKGFNRCIPNGLERFKGLGEMNPSQLKESTMDPTNRVLIQYTMESAVHEIEELKYISDNMGTILKNIKVNRNELE